MSIRKHDKATAEAIFNMIGWPESVVIRDDGVYLNEDFRAHSPHDSVFDWTPAYDMDWEGAPNPITAPVLPIPFTSNELAACMLDGPGFGIQEALDSRIGYPLNEEALRGFSLRLRKVAEAMREAYVRASEAQNLVGEYDHDAEQKAHEQLHQFDEANGLANKCEGVFESGITPEEAEERRVRARASVAELKKHAQEAKFEAEKKWRAWRKAMVIQLLGHRAKQPDQIAQKFLESQSEECLQLEVLYEAAVSRLEDASKALERRKALLAAPQNHGGLAELEALEAAVEAKRKEVEDAQHALRVMRGDFLEFDSPNDSKNEAASINEQHETEFAIAFYGACLDLEHWTGLNSVQPLEAAMLLNNENPLNKHAHSSSAEIQKLQRVFEDHSAVHPARRALLDWIHIAQVRKAKYDTTVAETVLAIAGAAGLEIGKKPISQDNQVVYTSPEPEGIKRKCFKPSPDEHGLATALRPRAKRRDLLAPLIERAQREVDAHDDTSAVFALMRSWAKQKPPPAPLIGATDGGGIQWLNHADEGKELTISSLSKRIKRAKTHSL